jgi:hypothetical protein
MSDTPPLPFRKRPISPENAPGQGQEKRAKQDTPAIQTISSGASFGHYWAVVGTSEYVPPSHLAGEPSEEIVTSVHVYTSYAQALERYECLGSAGDKRTLLYTCAVHESFLRNSRKPAIFCDLSNKSIVPASSQSGPLVRFALLLGAGNVTEQFESLLAKAHDRYCHNGTHVSHETCLRSLGHNFCLESVRMHKPKQETTTSQQSAPPSSSVPPVK